MHSRVGLKPKLPNSPMKPTSNSVATIGAPPLLAAYWYVGQAESECECRVGLEMGCVEHQNRTRTAVFRRPGARWNELTGSVREAAAVHSGTSAGPSRRGDFAGSDGPQALSEQGAKLLPFDGLPDDAQTVERELRGAARGHGRRAVLPRSRRLWIRRVRDGAPRRRRAAAPRRARNEDRERIATAHRTHSVLLLGSPQSRRLTNRAFSGLMLRPTSGKTSVHRAARRSSVVWRRTSLPARHWRRHVL